MPGDGGGALDARLAAGHVLVDAVRGAPCEPVPHLTPLATRGLVAAAAFHGVAGYVHQRLADVAIEPSLRSSLRTMHQDAVLRHMRTLSDLRWVHHLLGEHDVPWLVVKGPVLTRAHGAPGLRSYADLDVLVPPAHLRAAIDALGSGGATVGAHDWSLLRHERAREITLGLPSRGRLDLHWALMNEAAVRDAFRLPLAELFERAEQVTLGGTTVATTDPIDTLLHLSVHAAADGGNRLLWLKDIERHVATRPVDWDEVVRRAGDWGVRLVMAVMLQKAVTVLAADVPAGVLRKLDPSRVWSRVSAGTQRLSPLLKAQQGPSLDRMVTRSTRTTTARSVANLAARTRTGLRERVVEPRPPGAPGTEGATLADLLDDVEKLASSPDRDPGAVTIVVVTYESADVLPGFLSSIRTGTEELANVRLLVVDNDSADATLDVVGRVAPAAEVVRLASNLGYAAGVNAGLMRARGDHVLVANPDVRLHPGALARLLAELRRDPGVGIAVPRILDENGDTARSLRRDPTVLRALGEALLGGALAGRVAAFGEVVHSPTAYDHQADVDWASGAVMLLSRRCVASVGPWDERFFLYSEETEYSQRTREAGLSIRYVPDAVVTHLGGMLSTSPELWSLSVVNRLRLYGRRHGKAATAAFHGALLLNEGLRALAGRRTSQAALRALLQPTPTAGSHA